MDRHMASMGLQPVTGWAESASKLNLASSEQCRDKWIARGCTKVGGPCATALWHESSAVWVRLHHKFRSNLFPPMKVAGGPMTTNRVGPYRLTLGMSACGLPVRARDEWSVAGAKRVSMPLIGCTIFIEPRTIPPQLMDAGLSLASTVLAKAAGVQNLRAVFK